MTRLTRRTTSTAVVALASAATLAACGGGSGGGSGLPPAAGGSSSGSSSGSGSVQSILADAPVADASAIPAGSVMAKIKKRGQLIVGGTDSAPLFSLKNPVTGDLTGFDADLSKMLAKYITGKPDTKLVLVKVDTRETLLQNGTVDTVFATYTITPKRAQKVDFAGPYYESGDAIMTKKGNSAIKTVGDLNGKTVATEANSTAANEVKKAAPKAKLLLLDSNQECVQAVEQGRADAYVLDQAILVGDASQHSDVQVVGKPFTQEPYGIGVQKGTQMKQFVNDWLRKIEKQGLWKRLWKATVGTVVQGEAPQPPEIGSAPGS